MLALAVGHWAYHKNREWNLLVKDLIASLGGRPGVDDLDDPGPSTTPPPIAIDLTSTNEVLGASAAR